MSLGPVQKKLDNSVRKWYSMMLSGVRYHGKHTEAVPCLVKKTISRQKDLIHCRKKHLTVSKH